MSLALSTRRQFEAHQRSASLQAALDGWRHQAEGSLQSNQSQILAAERMLRVILNRLQDTAGPLPARDHLRLTVHAHSIWEALNARFAQRTEALFQDFLQQADQLAYDCYFPALEPAGKAPPLVVFAGALDPQMYLRNQALFLDPSSPLRDALPEAAAASHFPFPLITLPWHQRLQPESLVFIAHEVGHAVEDDLRLTAGFQEAIAAADIAALRKLHWLRWQRELFADHWACQACGEAYVCALADYLSTSGTGTPAINEGSRYPPAWLRIEANLYFLQQLDVPTDTAIRWREHYSTPTAEADFLKDLAAYRPALIAGAPKFEPTVIKKADRLAGSWSSEFVQAPAERSMRLSAAAYRLAYEADANGKWIAAAKTALAKSVVPGVRAGHNTADADRARGAALLALLLSE